MAEHDIQFGCGLSFTMDSLYLNSQWGFLLSQIVNYMWFQLECKQNIYSALEERHVRQLKLKDVKDPCISGAMLSSPFFFKLFLIFITNTSISILISCKQNERRKDLIWIKPRCYLWPKATDNFCGFFNYVYILQVRDCRLFSLRTKQITCCCKFAIFSLWLTILITIEHINV